MPPDNVNNLTSPVPEPINKPDYAINPDEDSKSIATPGGVGIKIDNVNQSTWQFIRQRKMGELLLVGPLVVIWEAFIIFLFVRLIGHNSNGTGYNSSGSGRGFGYLIVAPFLMASSWYYKIKKQFEDAFLEEFARSNGYSFQKIGIVDETYGTIFRAGHDNKVSDIVDGSYDGKHLRMFLFETTIGEGRSQQTVHDTVIEIDLDGKLPNILMVNKKSIYGQINLAGSFGTRNTFNLEGDFSQQFALYGDPAIEIEALEVFNPDTMALMEDESKHLSVEFGGSRVYIYANGFIGTNEALTQVFALAKQLIAKIGPLASRLKTDSAITAPPVNITQNRGNIAKVFQIILIAFGATMFIFVVVLMIVFSRTNHTQPNYTPAQQTSTLLSPDSAGYQTATNRARAVASKWLDYIRQGDITDAYHLETLGYQSNYSQQQQLDQLYALRAPGATVDIVESDIGINDGTHIAGAVYHFTNVANPFYLEVFAEEDTGTWMIWGEKSSYSIIGASLPY